MSGARAPLGVLLLNLGTPAAPRADAVRRYLRQFLCDPRVVELPRWSWRPVLELAVLPRRAPRSAQAYAAIWTAQGAPLLVHTRAQAAALELELGHGARVAVAMRYGEPSIAGALDELADAECERIVLAPLFPQYCGATTGSALAECFRVLSHRRVVPALGTVAPFPDDPGYVGALAGSATAALAGRAVDRWVFSFHGIPLRVARAGDPYPAHCERTARALANALGLGADRWRLTWQSRFGRGAWLAPATSDVVVELAAAGERVAVVAPGFVSDCLETLGELGHELGAACVARGGVAPIVLPALNARADWIRALARLVRSAAALA